MILRDPVHGLVEFEGLAERVIVPLLATRELQRLRRVRQLGLTSLVFPGAEHSRFAHAVGAAHVMLLLQRRIARVGDALPPDQRLDDEGAMDGLAAALLHDLGHGPLSHLFEEVMPVPRKHEAWTVDVVLDASTDVHRALTGISSGMPERVAQLLTGTHRLRYLGRAISGTLDVDRCDYLLRDSHMTGVRYGLFDLDWLLRALTFAQAADGEWVLAIEGRKGLPPIESFFLGRHFMYHQVYHHKATRAAECLIRAMFRRVAELVQAGTPPTPMPPALREAALGNDVALGAYLTLDDALLLSCFAQWEACDDPVLSSLCRQLAARALPKTVPLPELGEPDARERWDEALHRAQAVVASMGLRADLLVWLDAPNDTPYAEPTDASNDGLFVALRHKPLQRLGDVSFLLGSMRNARVARPRLVFPMEARERVLAAVEEVLS